MADKAFEKFPKIAFKYSVSKPTQAKGQTVKGKTLEELRDALDKVPFWGRYKGNENMSYKTNGKKQVTEVSVTAKPQIFMPVWSDYSKASKEDQKAWDTMYAKLLKHENNHHNLALEVYAKLAKEVSDKSAEAEATNKAVEKEKDPKKKDKLIAAYTPWTTTTIKARMKTFFKDCKDVQQTYDDKTYHGEKEGIVI